VDCECEECEVCQEPEECEVCPEVLTELITPTEEELDLEEEDFEDDDEFYDPKNQDEYVCDEETEDCR